MRSRGGAVLAVLIATAWSTSGFTQAPPRTPRTFPQFAGTWTLDEQASTGTLTMAPRIARTLTLSATPEALTLTERLRLRPGDRVNEVQVRTVRFDGTPAVRSNGSDGGSYQYQDTFLLVADMLVISTRTTRARETGIFDLATDAFSVDGNVLTLYRQLSHVDPPGHIATMGFVPNNSKHTFVYTRATGEPVK
jgi:hypothetical protein